MKRDNSDEGSAAKWRKRVQRYLSLGAAEALEQYTRRSDLEVALHVTSKSVNSVKP
jgi:hypothetical protein